MSLWMVFDVESVGLHGEGFAVGYVVVRESGEEVGQAAYACDHANASGPAAGRRWVEANVPPAYVDCHTPEDVRRKFWTDWIWWKTHHPELKLAADCAWPVEARFLTACVNDDDQGREWNGPYPLHDVASIRLAKGFDPLATNERLPLETPAHHPLADARQSARLLIEALKK